MRGAEYLWTPKFKVTVDRNYAASEEDWVRREDLYKDILQALEWRVRAFAGGSWPVNIKMGPCQFFSDP